MNVITIPFAYISVQLGLTYKSMTPMDVEIVRAATTAYTSRPSRRMQARSIWSPSSSASLKEARRSAVSESVSIMDAVVVVPSLPHLTLCSIWDTLKEEGLKRCLIENVLEPPLLSSVCPFILEGNIPKALVCSSEVGLLRLFGKKRVRAIVNTNERYVESQLCENRGAVTR
mmetsp:Transcript_31659/g.94729  ORF Transcript_31659/g.94729 Transcript_31659/m.94729 type:complete len:172 (-) Transcript_31659:123-638(-)